MNLYYFRMQSKGANTGNDMGAGCSMLSLMFSYKRPRSGHVQTNMVVESQRIVPSL